MRTTRTSSAVGAVLILIAGCAGNGEGLDQNGRPASGGAATPLTADFNSIQEKVFTPICTNCHIGATAPRGLRLDAQNSYALLVGVASGQVPSVQRVQPGNPAASYLIQKLLGVAAVGARMPLDGPYLPQSTVDVISEWIRNGAPRSMSLAAVAGSQKATAMSEPGLQVLTTAPLNESTVETSLAQIVIGFDRELDANLVNGSTVTLMNLRTGSNVAARLSVPLANPSTALISPATPLEPGEYRLTLRGSGGGTLAGLDARSLNAPPGVAEGHDFLLTFAVSAAGVQK